MHGFTETEFYKLLASFLSRRCLHSVLRNYEVLIEIFPDRSIEVLKLATKLSQIFSQSFVRYDRRLIFGKLMQWDFGAKLVVKKKRLFRLDQRQYQILQRLSLGWSAREISTQMDLCRVLQFPTYQTLSWLTLPHRRRETTVSHYRTTVLKKPAGGLRLLEEPRPILKRAQRLIHQEILAKLPIHDAAHGYVPNRSVVSCVLPHVGAGVVLRMDLQDYFASIPQKRVAALLRRAGYEDEVALTIAQLCTNKYTKRKPGMGTQEFTYTGLPQGAPTSPTLANLVSFAMDRRLKGIAKSFEWRYTRYADDLVFSGMVRCRSSVKKFASLVAAIVQEAGFKVQFRKTKIIYESQPQHILGICINEKVNMIRSDYENLKATIHNCVQSGWQSQAGGRSDFRRALRGRIAFVQQLNPERAAKLLTKFNSISW